MRNDYILPAFHVQHYGLWNIPEALVTARKTMQTRDQPTLRPFVGKVCGVIDTSKKPSLLVGFVKIYAQKVYTSRSEWANDFVLHHISPSDEKSPYRWKDAPKYGYLLSNAHRLKKPIPLPSESFTGDRTARDIANFVSLSDVLERM